MKIQIMINGKRQEPVELDSLRQAHRLGRIPPNALAWDESASRWVPVRDVLASHMPAATAPELPRTPRAAAVWYYRVPGANPTGPVAEDELQRLIAAGTVPANALVFRQGAAEWTPVTSTSEFQPENKTVSNAAVAPDQGAAKPAKKTPAFSSPANGGENPGSRVLLRNTVTLLGIAAGIFVVLLLTYNPTNAYKAANGQWEPLPGYLWRSDSALFKTAVWTSGITHPVFGTHLHTGDKPDDWQEDLGFEVAENSTHVFVVWIPGDRFEKHPHIFANKDQNTWMADPGYDWVKPNITLDVQWKANRLHPSYKNLVSAETEGNWTWQDGPESGPTLAAVDDSVGRIIGATFSHMGRQPDDDADPRLNGLQIWGDERRYDLIAGEVRNLFPQLSEHGVALAGKEISQGLDGGLNGQKLGNGTERQTFLARLRQLNVEDTTSAAVADFVWRVFLAASEANQDE